MIRSLKELYHFRALLWSLTQRELQARYRGSALGFLWTFLNPTLLMLVYALIFGKFMQQSMPNYTYFMFVGLLPWTWFQSTLQTGATTISNRRDLLTKVWFPAQVLPATVLTTNFINYLLSLPLMVGLGLLCGVYPTWHYVAFPLVVLAQMLLTLALVFIISALNVFFRDLEHVITNLLTLMFFATPIIYAPSLVEQAHAPVWLKDLILYVNPMAILISAYQAIFYRHQLPDLLPLLAVTVAALFALWLAAWIFEERREEFAELI